MPGARQPFKITVMIPPFLAEHPRGKQNIQLAGRKALEEIVGDADAPVRKNFHNYAPKRTGKLSSSLERKELKKWRRNSCRSVYVPMATADHNKVNYAWFQEFGTKRSKGRFVWDQERGYGYGFRAKVGWHPGFKGRYFMAKTARSTSSGMQNSLTHRISKNFGGMRV
jgi:hypothetical protein